MRRFLRWLLLLLLCALCACYKQDPGPPMPVLQDGVWTGTGEGRSGTILVKVTIQAQTITDIVVVNQSESSFAQDAINEMIARALQKQALLDSEVDAVTGGVHGANRLGGNGVADIVVNGKIAGQHAAEYAQ